MFSNKKFISIDDNIAFSESIRNYLEDLNAKVFCFSDGLEAVKFIEDYHNIDLLLVDLRMPTVDGIELLKIFKQKNILIPTIIISATEDVQKAIEAVKLGAADFLSKPIYNLNELELCISKALKQEENRKELEEYRNKLEFLVENATSELEKTNQRLKKQIQKTKKAEEDVRSGSHKLLSLYESIVKNISKNLHDSVGQKLTLAKINLEIIKRDLPDNENLLLVSKSFEEIAEEISSLIKLLYPQSIEKYSLVSNIEYLINNYRNSNLFEISFNHDNIKKKISSELKLDIFRILQEALNNITKHSSATKVSLKLKEIGDKLFVTIEDNGSGFDIKNSNKGVGIFSIRERVNKYKGECIIESNKNKGTKIFIEVKL